MKRLSGKTLVAQAIRDLDIQDGNRRTDAMIEWAFEAEVLIASSNSFPLKECVVTVKDYLGELPRDFYKERSIKIGDQYPEFTGRDFRKFNKGSQSATTDGTQTGVGNANLADQRAFDSVVNINHPVLNNLNKWYISDGFIHITAKDTDVGLAYFAFPVDGDDPQIHPKHAEAVTAYIVWKYQLPRFVAGKISQGVYSELKTRWLELCRTARGKSNMPSRKEVDYLGGLWNNLKIAPPKQLL